MMNLVFHIAPAGGIRWSCRSRFGIVYFNSRPRVGGVGVLCTGQAAGQLFQFSPPRGGRPPPSPWCSRARTISILAPAWGASFGVLRSIIPSVFQFSPPRGGRLENQADREWNSGYFNSRPRVGGVDSRLYVSGVARHFNSRPRVGGVCRMQQTWPRHTHFNSRPRVGGVRRRGA